MATSQPSQLPPRNEPFTAVSLSSLLSTLFWRFWAVVPSALPCAGAAPPQRPALASHRAFSSPATCLANSVFLPTRYLRPLTPVPQPLAPAVPRPRNAPPLRHATPTICLPSSRCARDPMTTAKHPKMLRQNDQPRQRTIQEYDTARDPNVIRGTLHQHGTCTSLSTKQEGVLSLPSRKEEIAVLRALRVLRGQKRCSPWSSVALRG